MMKISTEIGSFLDYVDGDRKKAILYVKEAGFDAYDFSMFDMIKWQNHQVSDNKRSPLNKLNYKQYIKDIKKYSDFLGIVCNQAHAPFPTYNKICAKKIKRSIHIASLLNAGLIVVHPFNDADVNTNVAYFKKVAKWAKKYNIIVGIENMWRWDDKEDHARKASCSHHEEFKEIIDKVNSPFVKACLDIGHANMKGLNTTSELMIQTLNKDLYALHIHDNDLHRDLHQIPFSMKIDFKSMVNALKEIDYQGDITLEADQYVKSVINKKSVLEALKDLANSANKIRDMF